MAIHVQAVREGRRGPNKPDGFTIPDAVNLDGNRLPIPRLGKVRPARGSHHLYRGCAPKTVRLLQEGTDRYPKWYATVVYAVPVAPLQPPAADGELGVDRNVGQATDSDGAVYAQPDTTKLDANIQRKQRRRRENAAHQHSRKLADTAAAVVLEDLNVQAMTQSAQGTVEQPGTNVKAKSGLNREILASGWGRLERNLAYKAGLVVKVDPAYTSQTCAQCGHVNKENRKIQATFQCTACGHTANADRNAAVNILDRGFPLIRQARGTGASARRGAFGIEPTPTTREPGRRGPSPPVGSGT